MRINSLCVQVTCSLIKEYFVLSYTGHSVDAREIKARLELDPMLYLLDSEAELIPIESFLGQMDGERKIKCIRVAVECSIFWQLREFGIDFESNQYLLGAVWDILGKMEAVKIADPVEFAEYFNSNREFIISQEATAQASRLQPYSSLRTPSDLRPSSVNSQRPPIAVRPLPQPLPHQGFRGDFSQRPAIAIVSAPSSQRVSTSPRHDSTVLTMMNREVICKVCLDQPADVVLIPCGHFLSCSSCLVKLSHCPICRREIRGSIRPTFV